VVTALENDSTGDAVLRTRVLRTAAEVEAERERLRTVPWARVDADPDFFLAVVSTSEGALRPHVVLVERRSEIAGAFVGRIEDVRRTIRFGYASIARIPVRSLTLVHGGLVGDDDVEVSALLLAELEAALAQGDADLVAVPSLRPDTPFDSALGAIPRRRLRRGEYRPHHRLVLPESYEALLASWTKKTRYNVRRQSELLERALAPDLSFRILRRPEDAAQVIADLERVASSTYQRALGAGFADNDLYRSLVPLALRHGWLRAYVLYHRAAPIAFWHAYAYRRTLHVSTTGYDAAYAEHSPGTHVQMEMFRDACEDDSVDVVDFGLGDAQYKQRFGSEMWSERDATLFAARPRAFALGLAERTVEIAARAAARMLRATGLTDAVKRRWRRRLRADAD
jgi:CelD/BcsL family acetyltransferase involved in cellulose biosynthesis